MATNLYETLGISRNATTEEGKSLYLLDAVYSAQTSSKSERLTGKRPYRPTLTVSLKVPLQPRNPPRRSSFARCAPNVADPAIHLLFTYARAVR